jgi:isoleucyl-tRNA synthetase
MEQAGLRERALNEITKVSWFPEWGQARITDMIAKRPDWCISRQRNWGVPLPFIVHKENDGLHPRMQSLLEEIAKRVEQGGVDAWFDLDLKELIGEEAKDYYKINDTLDVWFDSGASFHAVLDARKDLGFPADLYLEGSDQHRGWFHSSLLAAVAMKDAAPYRQVLTHGFTVDAKGRKMSKSIGNTVAPDKVINTLGADILRLWVAGTDYRGEVAVSDEILQRSADAYRRIRNTARFLLSNLHGFNPSEHMLPISELLSLDHYIIAKADVLQQEILTAYETYQFHTVVQKIHNFCSMDLGSFYLDIIKDRQYTMPRLSRGRLSAQTAMYHLIEALTRWLAPILSFTSEELWQFIPGEREPSVFFSQWYDKLQALPKESEYDMAYWQRMNEVRDEINKALEVKRAEGVIGSGLEADVTIYASASRLQDLTALGEELRFVFITSGARVLPESSKPDNALATGLNDLWLEVVALEASKCERCWHRQSSVGQDSHYPTLCARCISNISGEGEQRLYA